MSVARPRRWRALAVLATLIFLAGCGGGTDIVQTSSSTALWTWRLPASFPEPRVPADNPMSTAKVALGRFLFYDRRLSGNGMQACGSCHQQARAFTDGRATSLGSTGEAHPRNAQALANVAYSPTLTWANPALISLESQMLVPIFGTLPVEMGVNDANKAQVLARLAADSAYPTLFAAAFVGEAEPMSWANVVKAIASFQRSLMSGNSRYDRYLRGLESLSGAESRGMNLFFGEKAECFHCHGGFNFNDQTVNVATRVVETPFHNTGLFNIGGSGAFPEPNRGVFELSGMATDMGRFRAPSLRNVEVTAPYMHDGSFDSLEQVLEFYAAGGRVITEGPHAGDGRLNPFKSELVSLISLSPQERADIVAFLRTLTDHEFLTDAKIADPFATR